MSSPLLITTTTPTSTLSNSGDRHVPTLQALVRTEPRSLGEQRYYVPPSWEVFEETQDFSWSLKKCSFLVRWRLCWATLRQQFNITSPTRGRIGAKTKCTVLQIVKNLFHKTRCFTDSKKNYFSSSTDILCSQLMDRSSGNELDQLAAINKYNPQPYYLIFFSITIVFQESRG